MTDFDNHKDAEEQAKKERVCLNYDEFAKRRIGMNRTSEMMKYKSNL